MKFPSRYFTWHGRGPTRRYVSCSLALALPAAAILAWPSLACELEYDRSAIANGELWRIATCQWTHWDLNHFLWDTLVFLSLGTLCERYSRRRFAVCIAASAVLIPLAVWLWMPGMLHFRGLSGIDSALFVLLTAELAGTKGRSMAAAAICLLGAFVLKTFCEVAFNDTIFVDSRGAFVAVPLAHAVGGVVGGAAGGAAGLLAALNFLRTRWHPRNERDTQVDEYALGDLACRHLDHRARQVQHRQKYRGEQPCG